MLLLWDNMSSVKKVERYRSFAVGFVRSWQCRSPKKSFKPNHVTTNTLQEFGWPYRNPAPTYQQKLRNSHVKHDIKAPQGGALKDFSPKYDWPAPWIAAWSPSRCFQAKQKPSKATLLFWRQVAILGLFFSKKTPKSIHNNLFKKNVWWCLINNSLCLFQKWYNKTKPLRHTTSTNVYIWAPKTYMFRGFLW